MTLSTATHLDGRERSREDYWSEQNLILSARWPTDLAVPISPDGTPSSIIGASKDVTRQRDLDEVDQQPATGLSGTSLVIDA